MLLDDESTAVIISTQPGDDIIARNLGILGFYRSHVGYVCNWENLYETYDYWCGQLVGKRITYGFRDTTVNPLTLAETRSI